MVIKKWKDGKYTGEEHLTEQEHEERKQNRENQNVAEWKMLGKNTKKYGCGCATVLFGLPAVIMPIAILQGETEIIGPWCMMLIFFLICMYLYKTRKKDS